jgi:uncharacterized membrane protein YfcA
MKVQEHWVEWTSVVFIVIGYVFSIFFSNAALSYITIFLGGFMAGRMFYIKHQQQPILPTILIILGFLLGFLFGSIWVNRMMLIVFFALGFSLSYILHMKKILVIFKSKNFLK